MIGVCETSKAGSIPVAHPIPLYGDYSSMVERWFVAPAIRVRFPLVTPKWAVRLLARTLGFHPGKTGSIPVRLTRNEKSISTFSFSSYSY